MPPEHSGGIPPFATVMTETAKSPTPECARDDAAAAPAHRAQRADARRNREALLDAANDAFTDVGASASLEDIARRAGVGIGTLYRHFPTRKELFEAVYVHEVEALCQSAADVAELPPWDALAAWLRRFVELHGHQTGRARGAHQRVGAARQAAGPRSPKQAHRCSSGPRPPATPAPTPASTTCSDSSSASPSSKPVTPPSSSACSPWRSTASARREPAERPVPSAAMRSQAPA